MSRTRLGIVLVLCAFWTGGEIAADGCVECDLLYVSADDWSIWSIDPTTGATVKIGYSSRLRFDIGISADGQMFHGDFLLDDVHRNDLCTLTDPLVQSIPAVPIVAMGGDRDSDDIFVAGPPLARMETTPGYATTVIGGTLDPGIDNWCGYASGDLSVDPTSDTIYVTMRSCAACPAGSDMLATLSETTGIPSYIGCITDPGLNPLGHFFAIAFDGSGTLYGLDDSIPTKLYTIDTTTTVATEVAFDGGWPGQASGMALIPCVPNCALDLQNPDLECGVTPGPCPATPGPVGASGTTIGCGEPFCLAAEATDDCGPLTLTTNQPPFVSSSYTESFGTPGTYTIAWTASDAGGNLANCSTVVNVQCDGCAFPPEEMQAWWRLDETTGTTAADSVIDVASDGTWTGAPAPDPAAVVDGGLCFDGIDDVVVVAHTDEVDVQGFTPDGSTADFAEDFSIDAWIKTSVTAGRQVVLDKREPWQNPLFIRGYMLFVENGFLGLQMGDSSTANPVCDADPMVGSCTEWIAATGMLADGAWHLIAATVDRDSPGGGTLWVDNVPVLTFDPTPRNGPMGNLAPLLLGREQPVFGSGTFEGCLDEVEFFKRALSAAEIDALWQAGAEGKCKCTDDAYDLICAPGEKEYDVDNDGCYDICLCDAAVVDAQCEGFDYASQCTVAGDECPVAGEIPVDTDCDGLYDACQSCPPGTQPHDTDGDGCDDVCDCFIPIVITVDVTAVSWPFDPEITTADGVFGTIGTLTSTSGGYKSSTMGCLGSTQQGTSLPLPQGDPPPGEGWWFLVRGNTQAGTGSYDPAGSGWTQGRDAGIAASGRGCP